MNKAGTQRIETDRLILRRFRSEDAEDMYANWASDPEVTRFLTWPAHSSVYVTKALLADWIPRYEDGGYFNWAMEYKNTGKVIGNISVVRLIESIDAAEMGYCMSRAYWGQGLMPEAVQEVIRFFFEDAGLDVIFCGHFLRNIQSARVQQKCGFKHYAYSKYTTLMDTVEDIEDGVLTREMWIAAR